MELKYIIFAITLLAMIPAVAAMLFDKRLIRFAMLVLLVPLLQFNGTAINFLSMENYHGTSRGMEVSLCYIIAWVVIVVIILRGGFKLHLPTVGGFLFFLYFMWSVFSMRSAANKTIALFEIWKMIMLFLVYLAVFLYLEYSKGDFDILVIAIEAFILICFVIVLKQHYIDHMHQVKSVFPHQNSLAMFLVLVITIPFSQFLNRRKEIRSWFSLFIFCCGAVCTLRTYSRGAFITFPIAILVTFFISLIVQFRARKVHRVLMLILIGFLGFMIFLPKIILRFEQAHVNSFLTRKQFVTVAMNIIRDNKLTGIGINNWSLNLINNREYVRDRNTNERMDLIGIGIVETIYLLVAAECGIPCLIVLLCWFFYYFFISLKLAFLLRKSKYFFIPAAAAGGLLGIYIQSCGEWVLKQSMNFIVLMMIFAMLGYLNRHYKQLLEMEREENAKQSEKQKEAEDSVGDQNGIPKMSAPSPTGAD